MKIAILIPMAEERLFYLEKFQIEDKLEIGPLSFDHFKFENHEIYMGLSGIGKVQAAMTLSSLLAAVEIDLVLVTGSAGSLDQSIAIGDLVLANDLAYFDVDAQKAGNYVYGQLPQEPATFDVRNLYTTMFKDFLNEENIAYHEGQIVTGDSFVASADKKAEIKSHFPKALGCEMEGAAFAQVAKHYEKPILVLRAISDSGDDNADFDFDQFVKKAGKNAATMIIKFLEINKF